MEIRARVKHVAMPARKVRPVVDRVRGMDVAEALTTLKFLPQAAAGPVFKLIHSAVANGIGLFNGDRDIIRLQSSQPSDAACRVDAQ